MLNYQTKNINISSLYQTYNVIPYNDSELKTLSLDYAEIADDCAYRARYFIKNGKKWIHNIEALRNRLIKEYDRYIDDEELAIPQKDGGFGYNIGKLLFNLVLDIPKIIEYEYYYNYKLRELDFIELNYFSFSSARTFVILDLIFHHTEWAMKHIQILHRNQEQKKWVYDISLPCYHYDQACFVYIIILRILLSLPLLRNIELMSIGKHLNNICEI